MLLRNKQVAPINFSRGVDLANWIAEVGWGGEGSTEYGLISYDNYTLKELQPGCLADIVNLKFTEGGSGALTQRDVVARIPMPAGQHPDNTATNKQALYLATRIQPENQRMIYYVRDTVTNITKFYYTDGATSILWFTKTVAQPNLITQREYIECVYYNDRWYFYVPGSSSFFSANADGSSVTDHTDVNITDGIRNPVMYRERVFGFSGSKVFYSKPTDPTLWASPDGGFFVLGTGQPIRQILVYKDQLWCVDVGGSLWKVYFSNDPAEDGVVRRVSDDVNILSLCVSDNRLWAATNRNVFEVVNEQLLEVGNNLWLQGGKYTEVKLFNVGFGLMLITTYEGLSSSNCRIFVFDYRNNAWVRYEFPWFDNDAQDTFVTINQAVFSADADRNNVYFEIGAPLPSSTVGVGNAFYPLYQLHPAEQSEHSDAFIRVFDGNGTTVYQRVAIKLRSGPLYMGMRNQFKRFHFVMMNAFLGWKRVGIGVINKTPYKTTIQYIPTGMANKADSTKVQRIGPTEHAGVPYKIGIQQRARAVVFQFETEDKEYWSTLQDIVSATQWEDLAGATWASQLNATYDSLSPTENPSPVYIDSLELVYSPVDRTSSRNGQDAFASSMLE
ncbi:MAG TPA: hypothetical protein VFK94_02305 [Patescibacteria group bacterium]|nr:hypothetical protein [Patescibacteria group bacterium]